MTWIGVAVLALAPWRGVAHGQSTANSLAIEQCDGTTSDVIARTWNQTVTALRAIDETSTQRRHAVRARLYQQVTLPEGRIIKETDSILEGIHTLPFIEYSPETVAQRRGYVVDLADGTRTYVIPEPATFTNDRFESTHCFSLDSTTQTVSLQFQPRSTTDVDGLSGAFVLDRATGDLQRAQFDFPRVGGALGATPTASLHFAHVDPGDWFVTSWQLHSPVADSAATTVLGFDNVGAHVLDVTDSTGNRVWVDGNITVLYGSVYDSLQNGPLQRGVVAILGTGSYTQTDENGDFALAGYSEGTYGVVFGHPRLDSVGFVSPVHIVQLRRGAETGLALAVPPLTTVLEHRCPELIPENGYKMLVGVVRDDATGQPVAGAMVSVSRDLIPQDFQVFANERSQDVAITDSLGMYSVCDVPTGVTISVAATKDDGQSPFLAATFGADAVTYGAGAPQPLIYPVGRLDLTLKSVSTYTRTVTGTVTDALTGFNIPDVTVSVEGTTRSANTDSAGVFTLRNLPDGSIRLNLRKVGYRMLRYATASEADGAIVLGAGTLSMVPADPSAVTLDPIEVQARGVVPKLSEFEERRSRGFGAFLTKDDFEKWNPTNATDVLRRMQGVRVRPNPYYGVNGDTRRHVIEPSRDIGERISRVIPASETRGLVSSFAGQDITIYECPMLLFYDGVFVGDSYATDVDNLISTTDLSAVEVYSPSQVPAQFSYPGATCGVVVFWTY